MQETTNLHLKKYEPTDIVDLLAINPNWDTLDTSISGHVGATTGVHSIGTGYYVAKTSNSNQLPDWADIQNKPTTLTLSSLQLGNFTLSYNTTENSIDVGVTT